MIVRFLGLQDYLTTLKAMQEFTKSRNTATIDEIWLLEHYPVFTQGKAGQSKHILADLGEIKVVNSDRGGQITYHGFGQLIVYFLLDLVRKSLNLKKFINILSTAIIDLLAEYNITATTKEGAPGVYINEDKICSIGLKVVKGCTYHGLSLNVNMDLQPFEKINPCGYLNLKMTQLSHFVDPVSVEVIAEQFSKIIKNKLQ